MIKIVKFITKVLFIVTIYSFIGGMVFSVHNYYYPKRTRSTTGPIDMSIAVGAACPVLVPVWGMAEVGRVFSTLGSTVIEDLTNE